MDPANQLQFYVHVERNLQEIIWETVTNYILNTVALNYIISPLLRTVDQSSVAHMLTKTRCCEIKTKTSAESILFLKKQRLTQLNNQIEHKTVTELKQMQQKWHDLK